MAGFAWVTLATNDSYSLGALVLAHSLRRVGSKHDLAVLVTPGVTGAMREKLASVFSLVQEVNVLDSKDEANLALLARPELGITFTKLHCWRLTQYEKCVFVDADTLVIRNCDELFEREEFSAAPDVGWPDCFNSGVFVFKPSQQTFASITSFAAAKGSFDGGDQGLLNQYFSDWAHKDISKHLPFIYNMCSTATYSYLPAFKQFGEDVRIIHFIGITKPWLQYFDTVSGQVQPAPGSNHLQPLLQLWWQIFCENVHPQLSPVMASSTLASVWHEFNPLPSQSSPSILYEKNDLTYDNIQSTEPDFSEFQDPWDKYTQESSLKNVSVPADNHAANNHHHHSENNETNHFSSNPNDNYYHQPLPSHQFPPNCNFDSQNYSSNTEINHEYRHSSVLDDSQNNTQDNSFKTHQDCSSEHRNFTDHERDHYSHETHNQMPHSSQTRNEKPPEYYHHQHHHHEQNVHEQTYYHNPDNHRDDKPQEDCHHQSHHQYEEKVHEQNQEQTFYHNPNNHRDDCCNDNRSNSEHAHEEHHNHDHSFEKNRQTHDDNFHNEKQNQQHCNRESDDFSKHSQTLDQKDSCRGDEHAIRQSSFENSDEKCNSRENRLQTTSNINYHEKHTDVHSTNSYSTSESTTKSQSPPEPCSKSKSIATQSEPNIAGQLESNDAGIAGALAKITLGEARSPEQVAFEEHMRKQSWEQGQIDYMGRDSFDNIWKKISQTLSVSQRQPSPPKTLPEPEKPTAAVAAPVSTEADPTAKKSEAAVLAEPQQKEDRDLTSEFAAPGAEKLIPPSAEVESQQISGKEAIPAKSSITDAPVPAVAPLPIEPQVSVVKTLETTEKPDKETSALATTTTTLVSSIPKEAAKTDLPETPAAASPVLPEEIKSSECQKDVKVQEIQSSESTSSQTVSESPVPIQVAESVLEAEVKESVSEDLRPVTEEAISSISVSAQESVPAVLATVLQAVHPPVSTPNGGGVLDPISEIGNGIDALTLSSPSTVTSAAVSVASPTPEVSTSIQTQDIRPPALDTTEHAATAGQKAESSVPQAATVDEPKVSTETQQTTPLPVENVPEAKISTETQETAPVVAESLPEAQISTETQQTAVTSTEKAPETKVLPETQEIAPLVAESSTEAKISTKTEQTAVVSAESVPEAKVLPEPEKSSPPVEEIVAKPEETKPLAKLEETKPLAKTEAPAPSPIESAAKPQELPAELTPTGESAIQSVEKSKEPEIPSETQKVSLTSAEATEKVPPAETPVKLEKREVPTELDQQCPLPVSGAPKSEETTVSAKIEETTTCSLPQNLEQIQSPKKPEEILTCPLKIQPKTEETCDKLQEKESSTPATAPVSESNVAAPAEASDVKVPKAELKEAQTSEEIASQSESSEESPVRPARTKELQIPGTPTITEATPPTSPPIGALESFEEQPTKTVKKVVKKVVKKSASTENKAAEGTETEGEVTKKVTKKVVKKVVKKTKEEDAAPGAAAESSSGNDKPKKVVKVVKKSTKTGQTLEADTTVPETPPPGSSEIPVPPKRKLKTIGKSTPAKSGPES